MSADYETIIGNRALQRLGVSRVTSFDDPSKAGRALTASFAPTRDALLAAHPWVFAMTRTTLQADADAPAFGFNNRFRLPGDCLSVVELPDSSFAQGLIDYRTGSDAPFAIEGGYILTNLGAPLKVRYLRAATSGFDPLFADALSWRLAVELADELTQSATKFQLAQGGFKEAMALARQRNAIQRPSESPEDGSWIMARIEGGFCGAGGSYGTTPCADSDDTFIITGG